MDFNYSKEQKMIADSARDIAKKFGPEYWYEKEENQSFPIEFYEALAKAEILGLGIPEEYGGAGMGLTEMVIAMDELCAAGGGVAPALIILIGTTFGAVSILKHGTEEQKKKYLPLITSGKMRTALGLTEPDAGTNTLDITTFATPDGNDYVINGNKIFITGVADAGVIILVTRTTSRQDSAKPSQGLSLFIVDLPNDAIKASSIPKHGINYIKTYDLGIDNLRVPKEALLGEVGKGWYHVLDTLNPERIICAIGAVAGGRLAITTASKYANERVVFGKPIGTNQGVQFPLAEAYAKLECAKLAILKAAVLYDNNENAKLVGDISNIAKFAGVEAGIEATYHAMQAFGGSGYAKEYHVERWFREVQLMRLAPITQQMTLNYIGEHILGMPKSY